MCGSVVISRLDRLRAGRRRPADEPAEDVALGQDADEASRGVAHEDRIAGAGALDRADAVGQRGARQDGDGLASAEHAQALLGERGDARDDRGSVMSVTPEV